MNEQMKKTTNTGLTVSKIVSGFSFLALALFTLFPMINLIRNFMGGFILFTFWRDYIFNVATAFTVVLLYALLKSADGFSFDTIKKTFKDNPAYTFLLILSIWLVISTAVTGFYHESVYGGIKSRTGLICSLVYFIMFIVALCIKSEEQKEMWVTTFLTSGLVIDIAVLAEYFMGARINLCHSSMIFYNSNHIGYYLLMIASASLMAFLLARDSFTRTASIIVYGLDFAAMMIANALGCFVALALLFVFAVIVLKLTGKFDARKLLIALLVTALVFCLMCFVPNAAGKTLKSSFLSNLTDLGEGAGAMVDPEHATGKEGSGRMALWKCGYKSMVEKPVFGYGLAEMRVRLSIASNGKNDTVHNEFLEYGSNHGAVGLLLYLAFIFAVFIRGAKHRKELTNLNILGLCAAFAYLVSSFFGVTMFYTAPYLFFFMAFGYYRESKPEAAETAGDAAEADVVSEDAAEPAENVENGADGPAADAAESTEGTQVSENEASEEAAEEAPAAETEVPEPEASEPQAEPLGPETADAETKTAEN